MPGLPLKIYRVAERSMEPTIGQGSYILVSSWYSKPKTNDIIVLRSPESARILVKRVRSVRSGKLFVVGDNKKESRDSRRFGYVDIRLLLGKVILII
ncbi:MAG: hypothetical protein KGH64_03565 [Candidatus Micrarchaeota archaeon]|nr:hypothetical protein [Candidatus Micrarchaeota archaeon]MDE1859989.1 hypothetical protein [Candidatus Micrarchaeota archaeon]